MIRPFRFIASMPSLEALPAWAAELRRLEDAGYGTVAISDHVTHGWEMEPLVTMAAAAASTTRLRLLTLVLANDYRSPGLVHRSIATLDALSGGRVELGLGAGWQADDYRALGLPFDPAPARIDRLDEAIRLIKQLFASPEPVTFSGTYYRSDGLEGRPIPIQRPRPPLLVGGGGRRILALAGREADIVGINASLAPGSSRAAQVTALTERATREKLAWVHAAAAAAGRAVDELELQVSVLDVTITASAAERRRVLDALADETGLTMDEVASSPAVLVGSVEQCADILEQRRATLGFSYLKLGRDPLAAAPLVSRLAGS